MFENVRHLSWIAGREGGRRKGNKVSDLQTSAGCHDHPSRASDDVHLLRPYPGRACTINVGAGARLAPTFPDSSSGWSAWGSRGRVTWSRERPLQSRHDSYQRSLKGEGQTGSWKAGRTPRVSDGDGFCLLLTLSQWPRNQVVDHLAALDHNSQNIQMRIPMQVLLDIDNAKNPMLLTKERLERAATENQFMNGKIAAIEVSSPPPRH